MTVSAPARPAPDVGREAPARPEPTTKHAVRPDIQGLRALAVLGVVADHLVGWPSGGFVGVDVFFVLSGFLITDLLLRERERSGRISILDFYRRRAKRILPAALLVLAVTIAASAVLLSQARWRSTLVDAGWSLGFAANWRFGSLGTDYFDANRPVSPLQHFWSLAVEEQFYVVWPTLIIVVLLVAGRARRWPLVAATAAVAATSFAWSLHETAVSPDLAYFSTFSRAWELAAGALLAVLAPALLRLPRAVCLVAAWLGLAAIVASYAVISDRVAFPAPWAALPVVGTLVVLAAGLPSTSRAPWPLTNRVSRYVGDISYSLYLWHFPVIVIGTTVVGTSAAAKAGLAVLIGALAVYGYELVENPLRRARWSVRRRGARGVSTRTRAVAFTLPVALMVATLGSVVAASASTDAPIEVAAPDAATTATLTPVEREWQSKVVTALQTTQWPDLTPSMDEAIASPQAPSDVVRCGASADAIDTTACTFGAADASRRAVVVGDSVSLTYVNPLRLALDELSGPGQWQITTVGTFGCPFVDLPLGTSQQAVDECASRRTQAVRAIRDLDPEAVFVADSADTPSVFATGDSVSEPEWRGGVKRVLQRITDPDRHLVVLSPPPGDKDLEECYTPLSSPDDCVGTVSAEWDDRAATEQQLATTYGGTWVDSSPWFCVNGYCPSFVDGTPVRSDTVHMTVEYGERIAPLLAASLRSAAPWLDAS